MLEKKLEKELKYRMKQIGGACHKFTSPGNNGMPDRICIFPKGTVVFVEMKKPKKAKLSEVQKEQIHRLIELNQNVEIIWNWEDMAYFFTMYGYEAIAEEINRKVK